MKPEISRLFLSFLVVIFFIQGCSTEKKEKKVSRKDEKSKSYLVEENQRKVILFFQSEDSSYLIPEARKIVKTNTVSGQAKQVIIQLISGSEKDYLPVLPEEVKLRELIIDDKGTAYVDFSRELIDNAPRGSYNEIRTVGAIVNTLVMNFDRIKRVMIMVEGKTRETLLGHIKLDSPFYLFKFLINNRDKIEDFLAGGESLVQLSNETGNNDSN